MALWPSKHTGRSCAGTLSRKMKIETSDWHLNTIFILMHKKFFLKVLLLSAFIVLGCSKRADSPSAQMADDGQLLLGNPSGAGSSSGNYFLDRQYYVMSYSASRNLANWVSWHVGAADLGAAERQDDFRADSGLPSSWYRVGSSSYTGSGFDRGHHCPSADRTASMAANSATFLMSNMLPQAPNHNRQTWANLEDYTRELVQAGYEVYAVMGSYGNGGSGSGGYALSINNNRIAVPARIWKVLVVIPEGKNDLSRMNSSVRVIAVDTPNSNSISSNWRLYRTSVNAIEQATGYNLLSNLPETVQEVLEAKVDIE